MPDGRHADHDCARQGALALCLYCRRTGCSRCLDIDERGSCAACRRASRVPPATPETEWDEQVAQAFEDYLIAGDRPPIDNDSPNR